MAPEQLEGGEVGPRTDLFAFGAVLYEMLAGRKAFDGQSREHRGRDHQFAARSLAERARGTLPPRLDRIVTKSLAKDPNARWQSARDLADELKWIAEERSQQTAATRGRTTSWLWAIAAGRDRGHRNCRARWLASRTSPTCRRASSFSRSCRTERQDYVDHFQPVAGWPAVGLQRQESGDRRITAAPGLLRDGLVSEPGYYVTIGLTMNRPRSSAVPRSIEWLCEVIRHECCSRTLAGCTVDETGPYRRRCWSRGVRRRSASAGGRRPATASPGHTDVEVDITLRECCGRGRGCLRFNGVVTLGGSSVADDGAEGSGQERFKQPIATGHLVFGAVSLLAHRSIEDATLMGEPSRYSRAGRRRVVAKLVTIVQLGHARLSRTRRGKRASDMGGSRGEEDHSHPRAR